MSSYLLGFIPERVSSVPACQRETQTFILSVASLEPLPFSPCFYLLSLLIWDLLLRSHLCSIWVLRAGQKVPLPATDWHPHTYSSYPLGLYWQGTPCYMFWKGQSLLHKAHTTQNYWSDHLTDEAETHRHAHRTTGSRSYRKRNTFKYPKSNSFSWSAFSPRSSSGLCLSSTLYRFFIFSCDSV